MIHQIYSYFKKRLTVVSDKSVLISLICAFIFTGFGQIYLEQYKKGIRFLLIHVVLLSGFLIYLFYPRLTVHPLIIIYFFVFVTFELYVVVDAYLSACRLKPIDVSILPKLNLQTFAFVLLIPVVMFVFNGHILLASVVKSYIVSVPPEPSVSMVPTIMKGDVFLVNKFIYRNTEPKQGDVVVFNYPNDLRKAFVKRVIAKGGDEVEIKEGKVYINDKLSGSGSIDRNFYLNQGEYGESGQMIRVPEGHYFVLGDNSEHSKDSRYWGFVGDEHIIGKAYKIIYPFDRSGPIF